MPVLSLPLSLTGTLGTPPSVWFPLRIPFTMIPRIGSILPASINGPFKSSLMALFRLAWSNKIQLPLLITVCFMAFDIRLQLEINIFWEPPRPTAARQQRDRAQRIANANLESIRAAAVNAALLQRQRQRQYLEQLARHELAMMRNNGQTSTNTTPDDDIEDDDDDEDNDNNEDCGFTTTSEEDEVEEGTEGNNDNVSSKSISNRSNNDSLKKKVLKDNVLKQKKKKSESGENGDEDDDETDEDSSDDEDNDDEEDDDNDDESGSGASQNPHPDYFGDTDRDDDDDFYEGRGGGDRSGDESDDSDSTGGIAPLVVELEIRQRSSTSTAPSDESSSWSKSIIRNISILIPTSTIMMPVNKLLFRQYVHHLNQEQHLEMISNSCHVVPSCDIKSSNAGHHLKNRNSSSSSLLRF